MINTVVRIIEVLANEMFQKPFFSIDHYFSWAYFLNLGIWGCSFVQSYLQSFFFYEPWSKYNALHISKFAGAICEMFVTPTTYLFELVYLSTWKFPSFTIHFIESFKP